MWIVLQPLRLFLHGLPVLFHKFGEHELQQSRSERHPAKQVPAGDYVDAAVIARNGRNRGQAGEPVLPSLDGFIALVGKDKVDGGSDGLGIGIHP